MSVIEVTRHHNLDHEKAVAAATSLAKTLASTYDVTYRWEGDTLIFKRSGVKGKLQVEATKVHVRMELGFLVRAFSARIERSIHSHLDNLIG